MLGNVLADGEGGGGGMLFLLCHLACSFFWEGVGGVLLILVILMEDGY